MQNPKNNEHYLKKQIYSTDSSGQDRFNNKNYNGLISKLLLLWYTI